MNLKKCDGKCEICDPYCKFMQAERAAKGVIVIMFILFILAGLILYFYFKGGVYVTNPINTFTGI